MSGHNDVIPDSKCNVDSLAVGGRRTRSVAVLLMELLQWPLYDSPLPEDPSGTAIQAEKHALPYLRESGYGEDATAPDYWRRMPLAGKFRLPKHTRRVPVGGDVFVDTRTVTSRATPTRPRFGADRGGSAEE